MTNNNSNATENNNSNANSIHWMEEKKVVRAGYKAITLVAAVTAAKNGRQMAVNIVLRGLAGLPAELSSAVAADVARLQAYGTAGTAVAELLGSSRDAGYLRDIALYLGRNKVNNLVSIWEQKEVKRRREPSLSGLAALCREPASRGKTATESPTDRALRYLELIMKAKNSLKKKGAEIPDELILAPEDIKWYKDRVKP